MNLLAIARLFLFVREAGPNHGARVNGIQTWGGGKDGDSWCAWLATLWLDLFFQGKSPLAREGNCEKIHQLALAQGWVVPAPQPSDFYLYVNDDGHAHHIGVVTVVSPLMGIAGNTDADGTSSNGDGCHEHALKVQPQHIVYFRVPGVA